MTVDVVLAIRDFNAGREAQRLAMKYTKMAASPFGFFRATAHLFYQRLSKHGVFQTAPLVWSCGDAHLENFGSYKADNGLVYFDINDFDEAALAPATWDLTRMLASIEIGSEGGGLDAAARQALAAAFMQAYTQAMVSGKAYWLERETATGPVLALLSQLKTQSRDDFLDSRTRLQGKKRVIRLDGVKALPASPAQHRQVAAFVRAFAQTQSNPGFYNVVDVARRIAGSSSLGLDRYMVLVKGKKDAGGNHLLDLKAAAPACMASHLPALQPRWRNDAQRVVGLQTRIQAVPMAFLHAVSMDGKPFVLRALQPSEDRVSLAGARLGRKDLQTLVIDMARLLAWGHLRSRAHQGSATADELIAFARRRAWQKTVLKTSQAMAAHVRKDSQAFKEAYAAGAFHAR